MNNGWWKTSRGWPISRYISNLPFLLSILTRYLPMWKKKLQLNFWYAIRSIVFKICCAIILFWPQGSTLCTALFYCTHFTFTFTFTLAFSFTLLWYMLFKYMVQNDCVPLYLNIQIFQLAVGHTGRVAAL